MAVRAGMEVDHPLWFRFEGVVQALKDALPKSPESEAANQALHAMIDEATQELAKRLRLRKSLKDLHETLNAMFKTVHAEHRLDRMDMWILTTLTEIGVLIKMVAADPLHALSKDIYEIATNDESMFILQIVRNGGFVSKQTIERLMRSRGGLFASNSDATLYRFLHELCRVGLLIESDKSINYQLTDAGRELCVLVERESE